MPSRPRAVLLALAVLGTAALGTAALGGCRAGGAGGALTDDLGRAVEVPPGASVFPLSPNVTELVAAAAGVERLAGVSPNDDHPPGLSALPRLSTLPLNVEGLVALAPGVVVGSLDVTPPETAEQLAALGLPTAMFAFRTLDDVPRVLRSLDTLLASRGGGPAADAFERRVATVRRAVAGFGRPRTLLLVSDGDALYAFGRDSYASEMVRAAGGDNVTDRYPGASAVPSAEAVLEMSPEVIVVLAGAGYDAERLLARHPEFLTLPAVLNRRVYGLDPDLVSRPGPRVAEGVERLGRLVHPEAFAAGAA